MGGWGELNPSLFWIFFNFAKPLKDILLKTALMITSIPSNYFSTAQTMLIITRRNISWLAIEPRQCRILLYDDVCYHVVRFYMLLSLYHILFLIILDVLFGDVCFRFICLYNVYSANPASPTLLSDSADGVARKIYPAINRAITTKWSDQFVFNFPCQHHMISVWFVATLSTSFCL